MSKIFKNFFKAKEEANLLSKTEPSRTVFPDMSTVANAFYAFMQNTINIPNGVLQQPIYDENYPTSVQYGAMGVVIGHEIVHGFDTNGVQFDKEGKLREWMDTESRAGFDKMAKCVVDQYGKFKIRKDSGKLLNGDFTSGENIADNGGKKQTILQFID